MEAGSSLPEKLQSRCCIAGGGPAGLMLGFLLARAGIGVLVLEKHTDFLRDFRGDTVHPSTLETMHELGLLEELLKRPHQEISQVRAQIGQPSSPHRACDGDPLEIRNDRFPSRYCVLHSR